MIIYLLAIPIFSFYVPLYAFWHFDDFSWGKTRATVGKDGKKIIFEEEMNHFNAKEIPMKKWSDFETDGDVGSVALKTGSVKSGGRSSFQGDRKSIQGERKSMDSAAVRRISDFSGSGSMRPGSVMPQMPPPYNPGGAPVTNSRNSRTSAMFEPNNRMSMMSMGSYSSAPFLQTNASMPSDDEIMFHVRRVLAAANLMTVSKRDVREELAGMFKVELGAKKGFINWGIDEVLAGR
jgi:chitin synthase